MKERVAGFFSRDRKTLYMFLSIVLVSIFSLTIVYAVLSVTLNIQGSAEVVASNWDIHLDNVKVTSGSVSGTEPSITTPTTATFSINLTTPGDFYEFTIDVVNDGSIDAMIDGVSKTPTLTETQAKYLNYIVEYQNGESINTKQLVSKNSYVRLKVRVEYRKDITASDLPTTSETLNLAFTVIYVQSDGSSENVVIENNGKAIIVVKGDGTQTGDEVCIGDECFYVMYSDDTSVTMLAKYNLYVGGEYDYDNSVYTPYGDEATGIQDSTMLGYVSGQNIGKGITAFSSDSQKGTNYSDFNGSIVEGYVNNYNNYLKTQGVAPIEVRLITKDELISLGCSGSICQSAPSWVYATSYWSMSSVSVASVYRIKSNGEFGYGLNYHDNQHFGVRPVIVIDKSLL